MARLPDFLVIGAPKAGSTALHAALAQHPQVYASPVKEPKYFLTPDLRPDPQQQRGPGDAHSAQEWIWRRRDYERLFADAPKDATTFESTPFYLWSKAAHAAIADILGDSVKLVAVIRDPVDRAFSNWSHLRADGLEPEADFLAACRREPERIENGWAPFWRYLDLGRYGEQLEHLYQHVDRDRVRVIRYRALIDEPKQTLDDLCAFLGLERGHVDRLPDSNVGRWAADNPVNDALRQAITTGARVGALLPPQAWRAAEKPLKAVLQRGSHPRPRASREARAELVEHFREDVATLERLSGDDYSDWLTDEGRGMYTVRRSWEPSNEDTSA